MLLKFLMYSCLVSIFSGQISELQNFKMFSKRILGGLFWRMQRNMSNFSAMSSMVQIGRLSITLSPSPLMFQIIENYLCVIIPPAFHTHICVCCLRICNCLLFCVSWNVFRYCKSKVSKPWKWIYRLLTGSGFYWIQPKRCHNTFSNFTYSRQ